MPDQPAALKLTGHHGNRLHADTFGPTDGPPIVMVHGGGQTRHSWHATARTLGDRGWYAIAMDQRGHGDSEWDNEGRYHYSDFAEDLSAVITSLAAPPVLVGASLGGIACLLAEGGRPDPVARALILVDIAARMDPAGAQRIMDFMLANPEGFADLNAAADAVAAYNPHRPRPASNDGLAKNLRLGDDGRWRWHWDPRFMAIKGRPDDSETALDDAARALTLPTLLIRGQKSDLLTMEQVEHFLALTPHAQFTDVGGAGHMVAGDRNDVFSKAVLNFLDSLETDAQ